MPDRARGAGIELEAVQARGHRNIESARIYLHLTIDWLAGDYRCAVGLSDGDQAAVAAMVAARDMTARKRSSCPQPAGGRVWPAG